MIRDDAVAANGCRDFSQKFVAVDCLGAGQVFGEYNADLLNGMFVPRGLHFGVERCNPNAEFLSFFDAALVIFNG